MRVLVLNAGSSSMKASVVDAVSGHRHATADAEWPRSDGGAETADPILGEALDRLADATGADAVGYRVVHGGDRYPGPARVDDALLAEVERLDRLAPLHNHRAAATMRAARARLPDLPHVACFDTAFHATLPEPARRYALPDAWVEPRGIRRFGFHGLSVAWAIGRAADLLGRPTEELGLVVAHLGSGSSVTAVEGGRSMATSMGYTPLEGPVMGTRSGSVDPGILLELLRSGVTPDDLADGLATRSGLLALSGGTSDVRRLEADAAAGDARSRLALDMLATSVAAAIGAVATALGRLDALVLTGGIGTHATSVRGAIVRRLATLGVPTEPDVPDGDAIVAVGPPAVLVVGAREDAVIAREVATLLGHAADRALG